MRICTVVGARPQFIKAAVVSRALTEARIDEAIVHTGQHYDLSLSDVFFDELGLPAPKAHLGVKSLPHGAQTGRMMERLEAYLEAAADFNALLVYGDTNSTLAAAVVAAKMNIPLAHVEAGLRSFNRRMPEEVNRVVTDHLAHWLFCPTETAVNNLRLEGIRTGIHVSGDVMLDAVRFFGESSSLSSVTNHAPGSYYLATVHRASNTDDPARLAEIFDGIGRLDGPVLLPLHPRTRARIGSVRVPGNVQLLEPVGYLEMAALTANALCVLTDSGGLQKEACWLGVPCVTLRTETEWVETLTNGWNVCVGSNPDAIQAAARRTPGGPAPLFGEAPEGTASQVIARILSEGY